VIVSAICYSVFALAPFGKLVVADMLLYAVALMMEFAALVALRVREPSLRGVFRIRTGTAGVAVIAALPAAILGVMVYLSFHDGEIATTSLLGSVIGLALGPLLYVVAKRQGFR